MREYNIVEINLHIIKNPTTPIEHGNYVKGCYDVGFSPQTADIILKIKQAMPSEITELMVEEIPNGVKFSVVGLNIYMAATMLGDVFLIGGKSSLTSFRIEELQTHTRSMASVDIRDMVGAEIMQTIKKTNWFGEILAKDYRERLVMLMEAGRWQLVIQLLKSLEIKDKYKL